jgi:hypothetical protein
VRRAGPTGDRSSRLDGEVDPAGLVVLLGRPVRHPVAQRLQIHQLNGDGVDPGSSLKGGAGEAAGGDQQRPVAAQQEGDIYTCAQISRTSIKMIEKRYGHPDVERVHERYLAFMAAP